MKNKMIYTLLLFFVLFVSACSTQSIQEPPNMSETINDKLLDDPTSNYFEEIREIELVRTISNKYNRGLFKKNFDSITNVYSIHIVFNELSEVLTDMEIQDLLESLPYPNNHYSYVRREEGAFSVRSYYYEVEEIHIEIEDDYFIITYRNIDKNGEEFDPNGDYLSLQRKQQENKRYDVRVRIFGNTYSLTNVTRAEIVEFHNQKFKAYKNSVPSSQPGTSKAKGSRPINWNKDVDFLREYK